MRHFRIALLALALFAVPAAAPLHAQDSATAASAAAPVVDTAAGPDTARVPVPAAGSTGFTAPRTLRPYVHVFVAFAVAWVLLFGYIVFLARKFRRVEEQVDALSRS